MSKKETAFSLDGFSNESRDLVTKAQKFADHTHCRYFVPGHLLRFLVEIPEIRSMLDSFGIDMVDFGAHIHTNLSDIIKADKNEVSALGPTTQELLTRAKFLAECGKRNVNSLDIFYAMTQEKKEFAGALLAQFDLTPEKIAEHLDKGKSLDIDSSQYFIDLSLKAKTNPHDPIIGRDDEVRRLIQVLGRRNKHHPILVGEGGVGKRTIVLSLIDRINQDKVPSNWRKTSVVQLNTNNLVFGAKQKGEIEGRLKTALKSMCGYDIIVYIRSLDAILNANVSVNDFFQIFFENSNVRVITATTPSSFKKFSEKESALAREFTEVSVEPTPEDKAIEVLRGIATGFEKHHNIKIGEGCLALAVKLAKKHVQDRWLPESAIDLIDEAASNKMMELTGIPLKLDKARSRMTSIRAQLCGLVGNTDAQSLRAITILQKELQELESEDEGMTSIPLPAGGAILTEESVAKVLGAWTGIPVSKFLEDEREKVAKMEDRLLAKVIDQEEAVRAVTKAIKRSRAGLRKQQKPIGSFLLFGSSGTGKTHLAKNLASYLFDSEENLIRLDMSEFQEKHMVARLLGSPPGYANSDEGGFLTEAVKKKPYSVVLFDEIEKANPEIFNLLLQVLDDGRLSDSKGRLTDFSNTIIMMTSNLGSKKILDSDPAMFESAEGIAQIRSMLNEEVNAFLRPEFLNRIDSQIIFKPLTRKSLGAIADIEFKWLEKLLSDREIKLKVSDSAKEELINLGYVPALGARPLQRAIMNNLQDPLSEIVIDPSCKDGSTIDIDLDTQGKFTLSIK